MRLYPDFLLRSVPGEGWAVGGESRVLNAKGLGFLQGAAQGRGRAGDAAGSHHRRHRAVTRTTHVGLAAGVCH